MRSQSSTSPFVRAGFSFEAASVAIEPVAVLVGLAAGWQLSGMRMIVAAAMDPLGSTSIMVISIALLAAAFGPWFPERVILWVTRAVVRRARKHQGPTGDESGTFWMLRAARERDPAMHWLAVSVLATVAALAALLTMAASGPVVNLYHFFLERFFWTTTTLALLEWTGTSLYLGGAWVLNGLVISTLMSAGNAGRASPRHSIGVPTGLVIGFTLALWTHEALVNGGLSGGQSYMLGILPMFMLAGVAAKRSQQLDLPPRQPAESEPAAPEFSASAEGLIWISLVAWGVAAAWAVLGWLACRAIIAPHGSLALASAGVIFIVGLGFLLASFQHRDRDGTTSGCGMALWAAGLGVAATATGVAFWPTVGLGGAFQMLMLSLPMGYALRYVQRAWLVRVGSATLGFEQLLSAVFGGLGIGLLSGHFWVGPHLGAIGTLSAGSLLLMAFGGLLQIFANDRPVRIQHQRLALVFASLAGAIVLLPADARKWVEYRRGLPLPVSETIQLDWPGPGTPAMGLRVGLIGVSVEEAERWRESRSILVEVMPLESSWTSFHSPVRISEQATLFGDSAFRRLRYERGPYDLIYQRCRSAPCLPRFAEYSDEWFVLLAAHAAFSGLVVVDVPVSDLNAEAVAVIAATFRQAMPGPSGWTLVQAEQKYLRLLAVMGEFRDQSFRANDRWTPLDRLSAQDTRSHTIRRDRITPRLSAGGRKPIDWEGMLKP